MRHVGVDLSSTEVRVVEVSGLDTKGFARVKRFGTSPVKEGAFVAGKLRNPQAVSLALIRALKAAGVSRYGFVLGLSSPETAVARMVLPASIKPDERLSAITNLKLEVSPTVPLSQAVISTNLLRTDRTGEGTLMNTLVVAAALKTEVEQFNEMCRLARCVPAAIDLSGAATLRAFVRGTPSDEEVATVVDIGATRTTIVTREGLHLRSIRMIPEGGAELTRAVAAAGGFEMAEAERVKRTLRVTGAPHVAPVGGVMGVMGPETEYASGTTTPDEALAAAVEALVDQIAQAVELDAANHGTMSRGVLVCGGTALLRGLKERLQSRIGVEVRIGRPWARLEPNRRNLPYLRSGKEDPALMMNLATAVGLALWKPPA
jgi:type IV pilus assembly protein PilM